MINSRRSWPAKLLWSLLNRVSIPLAPFHLCKFDLAQQSFLTDVRQGYPQITQTATFQNLRAEAEQSDQGLVSCAVFLSSAESADGLLSSLPQALSYQWNIAIETFGPELDCSLLLGTHISSHQNVDNRLVVILLAVIADAYHFAIERQYMIVVVINRKAGIDRNL